ncbi:MAG: glycosyltransferase [Paludibacteraceae bacterium]|nr:glycosyltransferase [Paludibacteraceae bacterium]
MISIIVPVYRAEKYIVRCLDSLRTQTFSDIEVLLVDDQGGDNSIVIIQQYIQSYHLDKTWRIITMPTNSGPAAARNAGIHEAIGKYVAFVDCDDWVEPCMMTSLYEQAEQNNADISSSAAILDYPDGTHRLMENPKVTNGEIAIEDRKFLLMHYVSNFTTMLFRRDWLQENEIYFPDSHSGEDSCFMGECYLVARRIAQCETPFYHYMIYTQSISHRRGVRRGKQARIAFHTLLEFACKKGLMPVYWMQLYCIYIKKGILTPIRDYLKSIL